MPIVASDLVLFASANVPDIDSGTAGGAIDTARRFDFSDISATDNVEVLSDGADTRNITIEGRKSDGTFASETVALNGVTPVTSTNQYERILKVEAASSSGTRTVTVRKASDDVTIRQIPINERGFMRFHRRASSDPSVQKDYFAKGFWKNTHGSLTLTSALVKQNADPDARITHALAATLDDTATVANRTTDPGLTFDDTDKNVANSQNLTAGAAQGAWYRLRLPSGDSPHKTTYTSELTGQTV
jgi:hypothetical protein